MKAKTRMAMLAFRLNALERLIGNDYETAFARKLQEAQGLLVVHEASTIKPDKEGKSELFGLTNAEYTFLKAKEKVSAVKAYRDRTGYSIAEAKEYVEQAGIKLGLMYLDPPNNMVKFYQD
jgi:ribosomal protein L7/L12